MSERMRAVIAAGLVDETMLREFSRWTEVPKDVEPETDPRAAIEGIRDALEGMSIVELRQTALDAIQVYKDSQKPGRLYYPAAKGKSTFIEVTYGTTESGNYMIPWRGEDISDLMLNPDTYLKPIGGERVYFSDVTDLYYGRRKTFMICTPLRAADKAHDHYD